MYNSDMCFPQRHHCEKRRSYVLYCHGFMRMWFSQADGAADHIERYLPQGEVSRIMSMFGGAGIQNGSVGKRFNPGFAKLVSLAVKYDQLMNYVG